ncbi:class I SAM-dependent methyltransferase [Actinopolymorpha pittospori]
MASDARRARYDGLADWFDPSDQPPRSLSTAQEELLSLLGPGRGPCLDLACGTGGFFDAIRVSGRTVVGLDVSADQLRRAREREAKLLRADAAALPFSDGAFSTVVAAWMSTDVEDLGRVLAEVARVLRAGGVFVLYGAHPCFNGPAVRTREDGTRVVHPGYREGRWFESSPWWGDGIRRRVGMRHVPLADLMNAVIGAGLCITRVLEPGSEPVPAALALRAVRSP